MAKQNSQVSAFEKRSPGRQMRPINALGDPEPHHRWSGWRIVNSPKFWCWHSSSIVFKLFIGCPNQNYYKIMYTHYLSSWIYKYNPFFWGGGGGGRRVLFQGIQFAISLSLSFVWISTFVMTGHPGLGWATQPPALGGPYGDQGFWFFKSTAQVIWKLRNTIFTHPFHFKSSNAAYFPKYVLNCIDTHPPVYQPHTASPSAQSGGPFAMKHCYVAIFEK